MTPEGMVKLTGEADTQIQACLTAGKPKSFFLYAGAGSGKTRSLTTALKWIQRNRRAALWLEGRRIAVITYTNAATDEIKRRMEYDAFIDVSTIHAFAWTLISGFDSDIRQWLRENLAVEIEELVAAQATGRKGTKAAAEREYKIQSKTERLNGLNGIKRFIYSPTGDNRGRAALSHTEVIGIASDLLKAKQTLQGIVVNRYPILFVDESQDTNRHFMDALLDLQTKHAESFCLGLFGDTMQRIYTDGKVGLVHALPRDWARPAKLINYRCSKRVLRLINLIRRYEDGHEQTAPEDAAEGFVRMFISSSEGADRPAVEAAAAKRMVHVTGDENWLNTSKTLILEHHMAAARMGFAELFGSLYAVDRYSTPLVEGRLSQLSVLTDMVLPLFEALKKGDSFAVAAVMRKFSPIIDRKSLERATQQLGNLESARRAVEVLWALFREGNDPSIGEVLGVLSSTGLFEVPSDLQAVLSAHGQPPEVGVPEAAARREGDLQAWESVLPVPFSQVANYARYVDHISPFGTHQGVKGLEFPNVMVIIDDLGARGFMFSYDKLFGIKAKSDTDRKNEAQGIETTIDRTRRLLYVTCSRAKATLAIMAYCSDPTQLREYLLAEGWFSAEEIESIGADATA